MSSTCCVHVLAFLKFFGIEAAEGALRFLRELARVRSSPLLLTSGELNAFSGNFFIINAAMSRKFFGNHKYNATEICMLLHFHH